MMACKSIFSSRFAVGLLGMTASSLVYSLRINLSVAIVAMLNVTQLTSNPDDEKRHQDVCYQNRSSVREEYEPGPFYWSESFQGIILGSYFYGYTLTQIIGGRLSERLGAKWVCGFGVMIPAVLNALSPIAATFHEALFIAIRVLIGAFHGLVYSSLFSLYSHWFPKHERTTAIAAMQFGANLGAIIMAPLSGFLCRYGFDGGWPSVYYVSSAIHLIWFFFWVIFAYDSPAVHPRISVDEHIYILQNTECLDVKERKESPPWRSILTSRPVFASLVAKTTGSFGYYLLLTNFPYYLDSMYDEQIYISGIYYASIYLAIGIMFMVAGPFSNFLIRKSSPVISVTRIRKLFQEFALVGPAICLSIVPNIGCNQPLAIGLIIGSMCIYGFVTGGEYPIILEFAPKFAGTVFGVCDTLASVTGFLAPLLVGLLLESGSVGGMQWNTIFYTTSGVYIVGAVLFEIFASAEQQKWATASSDSNSDMELNIIEMKRKNENGIKRKIKLPKGYPQSNDTDKPEWIEFKRNTFVY